VADLTPKQARFVDEYLIDLNGTQAAIRAGYSADTAQEQASRLLSNVMVAEAVAERQKGIQVSTHVTQERVIREIARIALFDPRKMFDDDGRPLHVSQLDEDTAAAIAGLEVVAKGNADMGFGEVLKYKVADKNAALEKLCRFLGLYEQDNKQKTDPLSELLKAIGSRSAIPVVKDAK